LENQIFTIETGNFVLLSNSNDCLKFNPAAPGRKLLFIYRIREPLE